MTAEIINFLKQVNVDMEKDYYTQLKHIIDECLSNRKILSHAMYSLIAYCNEAIADYEHAVKLFLGETDDGDNS